MPIVQTLELTGAALDWVVAKCEGLPLKLDPMGFRESAPHAPQAGWWVWPTHEAGMVVGHQPARSGRGQTGYSPSTDWAQGGPLIESGEVLLQPPGTDDDYTSWSAVCGNGTYSGPTALVAAMRAYVASAVGDTAEVPEELL